MPDIKRAFVTGWPIDHSRSPLIHNHWLKQYGLAGEYVIRPCEPEKFAEFLATMKQEGFIGGNISIPHKETAFTIIDAPEPAALNLGAVNTIWMENGHLCGTNTDEYGFLANLDEQHPGWDNSDNKAAGALVLGAGGASRAIIHGLLQRQFANITIANRTLDRAKNLVNQFGSNCHALELNQVTPQNFNPAIIINTTSIGMKDDIQPIDLEGYPVTAIVHDIVYTPLITPLLAQAQSLNMPTIDGLGMLLHQAVPGFEKWFGIRPKVDASLRQLILENLGEIN